MQKPVDIIIENLEIQALMRSNLKMAVIVGGMMNQSLFSEIELYEEIAKLSYYGDKRVDNPNKVKNIVSGNLERFYQIYRPVIAEINELNLENGILERKENYFSLINLLPN